MPKKARDDYASRNEHYYNKTWMDGSGLFHLLLGWKSWLDPCLRIAGLGVAVNWGKVGGRKSYILFSTLVCITGSLVYCVILLLYSFGGYCLLLSWEAAMVILDGAEVETGLRT